LQRGDNFSANGSIHVEPYDVVRRRRRVKAVHLKSIESNQKKPEAMSSRAEARDARADALVEAGVARLTSLFGDEKALRVAIRRVAPGTSAMRRRVASLHTGANEQSGGRGCCDAVP
jgi:hypothetical protein